LSRGCGLLLLWAVVATTVAPTAAAHAVLLRTTPSANQAIDQSPAQISLLFSEPIDPRFTAARVQDSIGQQVDRGDGHVDADNDHLFVLTLQPRLPDGVYLVSWRSLSTIDIHPDQGTYRLFVGVPATAGAGPTVDRPITTATPATTLGRWWFSLAASLFGGVLGVWKLVLARHLVHQPLAVQATARRRAQRLIVTGGVLLVLGSLFTAVAQAAAAADVAVGEAFGQPLANLLLGGRFASIWWPRIGLEITSLVLIVAGGPSGLAADCALATLPAVLLTSSLTSHGAALGGGAGPGILVDWLHLVAATTWIGGLLGLLAVLPLLQGGSAGGTVWQVLRSFARLALLAAVLVGASGSLQASLELGSWSALFETPYGQLVLVKIGLLLGMLGLAGFNEWQVRRHTWEVGGGQPVTGLRRGIGLELGVGVAVLAVAAILTGTPPGRDPPLATSAGARGAPGTETAAATESTTWAATTGSTAAR
jgi:copper transport protein